MPMADTDGFHKKPFDENALSNQQVNRREILYY